MKDRLLSSQHEVYSLLPKFDRGALEVKGVMLRLSGSIPRPLLIGISAASKGKSLLIMGGSAVCFSFGTFWNKGIYSIQLRGSIDALSKGLWSYSHTVGTNSTILRPEASSKLNIDGAPKFTEVQRVRINECSDFHTIIQAGVPVVLEDLNLGCCNEEWTLQGLRRKIGDERQVS
jgi:tRNA wybutosine-synthesizing protein 4